MSARPLCIDLYCGLGGWAEGFLAEGYDVIGFDIERHRYPKPAMRTSADAVKRPGLNWSDRSKRGSRDAQFNRRPDVDLGAEWDEYPGHLVLQDVLTLHGSQFRDAAVIVASPPCQEPSYRAMPWKHAKALNAAGPPLNFISLFEACFRIQRQASEAAGQYIPLVVENVKGAQPWVGRATWHYGSYYLWGDVPALMPWTLRTVKVDGFNFHQHEKNGKGGSFQSAAVAATNGGSWFGVAHNTESGVGWNPVNGDRKGTGGSWFTPDEGSKEEVGHWKKSGCVTRCFNSKSSARKAASAQIAKIPFPLAQWIAQVYLPEIPTSVGKSKRYDGLNRPGSSDGRARHL